MTNDTLDVRALLVACDGATLDFLINHLSTGKAHHNIKILRHGLGEFTTDWLKPEVQIPVHNFHHAIVETLDGTHKYVKQREQQPETKNEAERHRNRNDKQAHLGARNGCIYVTQDAHVCVRTRIAT